MLWKMMISGNAQIDRIAFNKMPEQNVISAKDHTLQGYSRIVTCATDEQGFHNGNMKGGPEGEGRLDCNSQIFFSVCTCLICKADSTSADLKRDGSRQSGLREQKPKQISTCVYVNKK
ncbi:hypothetical protein SO802_008424, partial [Lithocarpus litseifolius]